MLGPPHLWLCLLFIFCLFASRSRLLPLERNGGAALGGDAANVKNQSRRLLQLLVGPVNADEALLKAAQMGDRAGVQTSLLQGAEIEARTTEGHTALIAASLQGFHDIVVDLLEAGADIEAKSDLGFTPLLAAAQEGHRQIVSTLIEHNANLEATTRDRVSPIIKAAENGRGIVLLQLLAAGAYPDSEDLEGETALFKVSAYPNNTFLVENLIDRGANPNHRSISQSTPLHYAAFFGNYPNSVMLLNKGAEIDAVNERGERPADKVCSCLTNSGMQGALSCPFGSCLTPKEIESLELLLGGRSTPEAVSAASGPASPSAAFPIQQAESPAASLDASTEKPNVDADQALLKAVVAGEVDGVDASVSSGANTETRNVDGFTPLIMASYLGHGEIVKQLLRAGASIEAKDNLGFTALQAAAQEGRVEVVRILISKNANVNTHSNDKATPLIKATELGHLQVVRVLLNAGAETEACCTLDGGSALTVAAEANHFEIVMELIRQGANVSATTTGGRTALFKANAHKDTRKMLEVLIDNGTPVNHRDDMDDTALGYAAFFGNKKNVKYLLGAGADPTIRNSMGELARDMVCHCITNEGVDGFLQCPSGSCDSKKKSKMIEKILEESMIGAQG